MTKNAKTATPKRCHNNERRFSVARSRILAALGFALLLAGCVQSLHPLFNDQDLFFEPAIVGTWVGESGNLWTFLKSGDKAYELIYTEKKAPAKFSARLGKLGNLLFLDLRPEMPDVENDLQQGHLLVAHTFSRVWLEGDTLRLAMLEHGWLKSMIDKKKLKIKHERLGDQIVLTASTTELQKFALKYGMDNKAFPKPEKGLVRKR